MEKRVYAFEVYGLRGKKIGSCDDDYLTENEMIMKARGILEGATLLRGFIVVKVFDRKTGDCCFEIKSK